MLRWTWWDWSLSLGLLLPSVLWHCWLGHLTHKSPSWYDLDNWSLSVNHQTTPVLIRNWVQTPENGLQSKVLLWDPEVAVSHTSSRAFRGPSAFDPLWKVPKNYWLKGQTWVNSIWTHMNFGMVMSTSFLNTPLHVSNIVISRSNPSRNLLHTPPTYITGPWMESNYLQYTKLATHQLRSRNYTFL